jgi:diguanylate cyclase (GGDEF)-like protein
MRTRRPTAVLFLNIDSFKDINDSRGHVIGDEVLVEVARRLSQTARHQDTVARSGSDEFLVLSEDIADIDEAVALAERMRTSLHAPMRIGDTDFVVTASVGIAMSPPSDAAELVRGAGIAMYRAKQNGRNNIAVFDHHNEIEVQERVRVQSDLRQAVKRGEFEVWYQPIVHLDDAMVSGVEALVRWRHPTRGLLLPRSFMSVAESTGLIREIGLDVLETACHEATAWRDPAHPVRVSVNISGLQVVDERLCEQVQAVLEKTGMDPEWLTLEVTESSAMRDQDTAERNLHCLHALGIRLALDDFGTGYSSLSFLRQLPVEVVKIDQSFVAGIGQRTDDELIVAGVISMAHALGHVVIAEGIETVEQRDALTRLGCRWGQGFLWSRAVPLTELASTIATIERDDHEETLLSPR